MTFERSTESTINVMSNAMRKIFALNQNDIDSTLEYLQVPLEERAQAKIKLKSLLSGDEKILTELEKKLVFDEEEAAILTATNGGVTKFKKLKRWGITYGDQLYISHEIVSNALDIGALISAISLACGPEAVPLIIGIGIALAALKLLDRENGIIITRIPLGLGPCVPMSQ